MKTKVFAVLVVSISLLGVTLATGMYGGEALDEDMYGHGAPTVEGAEDRSGMEREIREGRNDLDTEIKDSSCYTELSTDLWASDPEGDKVETIYENDGTDSIITYNFNGFHAEKTIIEEEPHYRLRMDGEAVSLDRGYPELPIVTRSIIIPDDKQMEVRVTYSEHTTYENVNIVPSKGDMLRSEHPDPSDVPYEFGSIYEKDVWHPQNIVNLRDPYIIRDLRGQVVEVHPFQYNPARDELRVYDEIRVQVSPVRTGGENILSRTRPLSTVQRDFAQIYERQFINYDQYLNGLTREPEVEDGNMLIISPPDFSEHMDSFMDWKESRGIPTEIVTTCEIGSNVSDISDHIEYHYHEYGLTYLLLVGDENYIPTPRYGDHESDPSYSFIVGDDLYPDIFVGRFSASRPEHVKTQVERSIFYEQNPHEISLPKTVGIASYEGPGYKGMVDWVFMNYIRDKLLNYDYTLVNQFYEGGHGEVPGDPTPTQITDAIEDGRHLINYCGHGHERGIVTSDFTNSDVHDLTNVGKLPFIIAAACITGRFTEVSQCFGEAWIRATHNGQPTGGIASFMSSRYQSWVPPMAAMDEMMNIMTDPDESTIKTTGSVAFGGCIRMNDMYGINGKIETTAWHLFGDPSIDLRSFFTPGDLPHEASVDDITAGQYPTIVISDANEDGVPLEGEYSVEIRLGHKRQNVDLTFEEGHAEYVWEDLVLTRADEYSVYVTLEEATRLERFTVQPGDADDLNISPRAARISAGGSRTFTAKVDDEHGNLIGDVSEDIDWSIETGAGGEWVGNVYTSRYAGTWTITGEFKDVTDQVTLEVRPGDAEILEISPHGSTITAGETENYTATAFDGFGNRYDVTGDTDWSDDIDYSKWDENRIAAETAGSWNITGTYEDVTGSTTLTVEPTDVTTVHLSPYEVETAVAGDELGFSAEAYDRYENLITDDATDFTWRGTDANGTFMEIYTGEYEVSVEYMGITSHGSIITVEPAPVSTVVISPGEDQTVEREEDLAFSAEAYDGYGNLITDNAADFTWQGTDANGTFVEETAGDHEVIATYEGVSSDTVVVTVERGLIPGIIEDFALWWILFVTIIVILLSVILIRRKMQR